MPYIRPEDAVYWQDNPVYNERQFSVFHMSAATLPTYADALSEFRPAFFHGYPSAIAYLAAYVIKAGCSDALPRIEAAFLVSEGVTPAQRQQIESAFSTRVFSFYGHSERALIAGECLHSTTYHQVPDYGILEIIDDSGQNRTEEGFRGELVGTGLQNRCMPLIRYRTGDMAIRRESTCSCGKNWERFDGVEGRWGQDMIFGKHGSQISVAALNMHGTLFEKVERYQYYQQRAGECVLRMQVSPTFGEVDREAICGAFRAKVGTELDIDVELWNEIPLTPRGKFRYLVSDLEKTMPTDTKLDSE
jgi:phenylacetate-CoA ligase